MSRIHPAENKCRTLHRLCAVNDDGDVVPSTIPVSIDPTPIPIPSPIQRPTVLTVWKRSSMSFQGTDGFTVFDRHGRLAFRVDNYSRNSHMTMSWSCAAGGGAGALVLMDGSGKPLLMLKPQIFSMQHQWNGYMYMGEDNECGSKTSTTKSTSRTRVFAMRRPSSVPLMVGSYHRQQGQSSQSSEAEVFFMANIMGAASGGPPPPPQPDFRIEGSFWRRNCKIKKPATGEVAAKIVRKRAGAARVSSTILLSDEVFTLVVQPGFDPQLIMAFVVILDRICCKPFTLRVICA